MKKSVWKREKRRYIWESERPITFEHYRELTFSLSKRYREKTLRSRIVEAL